MDFNFYKKSYHLQGQVESTFYTQKIQVEKYLFSFIMFGLKFKFKDRKGRGLNSDCISIGYVTAGSSLNTSALIMFEMHNFAISG